ncbi:hypothetical protein FBZ87_104368 [Nitrospirillum amazonense]|uniref:Uncharacterized protein n=2 Tax=Nitrospirillum amazonense TaxID=28077 RepID=A0A560JVX8_9PROT|nr:hypothetical protein FBZ87_104368 [Nitrospirillum amazonense]
MPYESGKEMTMAGSKAAASRTSQAGATQRQFAHEAELLREGLEDMATGRFIEDDEVDAWLDRLVQGEDLDIQPPQKPLKRR